MHEEVRRFSIDGIIDDRDLVGERERLISFVETMMRDEGFVPLLDMDPHFTLDYKPVEQQFHFMLSVYGVESPCVGSAGVMQGKVIS